MTEPTFPSAAPPPLPRVPALTALRWFAACAVVAFHVGRYVEPLSGISAVTGLGYSGVGFFFVLSGFVLAWSARAATTTGEFYGNRFARVWPLHALTTATAALPLFAWEGVRNTLPTLPAVLLLVQAWFPYSSVHYSYNGVSWSLSCEAFFYLAFPLFAPHLLRWGWVRLRRLVGAVSLALVAAAALVMAVVPQLAWEALLYVNPAYRLGEFVIGVALAAAVRNGWHAPVSLRTAVQVTLALHVALLLLVGTSLSGGPSQLPLVVTDLVMLPAFCLIVSAAATDAVLGRATVLSGGTWIRLGEWSFALYLVHELVLRALHRYVSADTGTAVLQTLLSLAIAVGLSAALHHGVERPCDARLRAFFRRRRDARRGSRCSVGEAG